MKRRPLIFPVAVVLMSVVLVGAMLVDGSPRGGAPLSTPVSVQPSPGRTLSRMGVYAASALGKIVTLNADTGVRRWSLDTGATMVGSPTLANGALYLSVLAGAGKAPAVYALDASDGHTIWHQSLPFSTVLSAPVVVAGSVFVAAGTTRGGVSIVALSEKAGTMTSLTLASAVAPVMLTVSDGSVYVATGSATSGTSSLYVVMPGDLHAPPPVLLRQAGTITTLAVASGVAYVTTGNAAAAFALADGARLWQYAPGATYTVRGPAIIASGTLYLVAPDTAATPAAGWLYAVSATTGQERWRAALGGSAASAPLLANGTLYVATDGHALYAVSASTGAVQRQVSVDASASIPPVYTPGALVVGAADGTVTALRASGESVLWTARTGTNLMCIALG